MDLFKYPEILDRYLEDHSSSEDQVLAELSQAYLPERGSSRGCYPAISWEAFSPCSASWFHPPRILEIGTYTGYSAICLARGLARGKAHNHGSQ